MEKLEPISYERINTEVVAVDRYHWNRIDHFKRGLRVINEQGDEERFSPFIEENEKFWQGLQTASLEDDWYLDKDERFNYDWANGNREYLLFEFSETDMDYLYLRDILTTFDGLDRNSSQMAEEIDRLWDNSRLAAWGLADQKDAEELSEIFKRFIDTHRIEVGRYRNMQR